MSHVVGNGPDVVPMPPRPSPGRRVVVEEPGQAVRVVVPASTEPVVVVVRLDRAAVVWVDADRGPSALLAPAPA